MSPSNGGGLRPVRVLGIGGSTRRGSLTLIALEAALGLAREAGAETVLADVRELALPVFDADLPLSAFPPTLPWLLDEARRADAYLIASPIYHATISGAVKNVLDSLDFLGADGGDYFGGKPVGLIVHGGGSAANVLTALLHATRAMKGLTVPTVVAVPTAAIDAQRRDVTDPAIRNRLAALVGETVDLAWRLRRPMPVPAEPWETAATAGDDQEIEQRPA
jgi:FMN reductase